MDDWRQVLEKARGEVRNHALSIAMRGNKNAKRGSVKSRAIARLDRYAVPMMEVEYSREAYNKLFKGGYVKTPINTVKMGTDQFEKLGRKDSGGRRSYIGAAYQTLTDPVVILKEGTDDVYIKSFVTKSGISTFMSVEKDKADGRFVVTNYMRHKKEIIRKIKWADSIAYLKGNRGSPANGVCEPHRSKVSPHNMKKSSEIKWADGVVYLKGNVDGSPACMDKEGVPHATSSHTSTVSRKPLKKSNKKRFVIKKSVADEILRKLARII
jgi:hypothetical protein